MFLWDIKEIMKDTFVKIGNFFIFIFKSILSFILNSLFMLRVLVWKLLSIFRIIFVIMFFVGLYNIYRCINDFSNNISISEMQYINFTIYCTIIPLIYAVTIEIIKPKE